MLHFLTILCLLTSTDSAFIGDNNATHILTAELKMSKVVGILFVNRHCAECEQSNFLLDNIIRRAKQSYTVEIYLCEITANSHLQELFGTKRFPMLHYVLAPAQQQLFYVNRVIVAWSVIEPQLSRLTATSSATTTSSGVMVSEELLSLLGLEQRDLTAAYAHNDMFCSVQTISPVSKADMVGTFKLPCHIGDTARIDQCLYVKNQQQLNLFMREILFSRVNQFYEEIYNVYQQMPPQLVFVAVLDSVIQRELSTQHIGMLNRVLNLPQFRRKIIIFWMETRFNSAKKELIGFAAKHVAPLFARFDLTSNIKAPLLLKGEPVFTEAAIVGFIEAILESEAQSQLAGKLESSLQHRMKLITPTLKFLSKQQSSFQEVALALSLCPTDDHDTKLLDFAFLLERLNMFVRKPLKGYVGVGEWKRSSQLGVMSARGGIWSEANECMRVKDWVIGVLREEGMSVPDLFCVRQSEMHQYLLDNLQ